MTGVFTGGEGLSWASPMATTALQWQPSPIGQPLTAQLPHRGLGLPPVEPPVGADRGLDSPLETLVRQVSSPWAVCSVRPWALGAQGGRLMSGRSPALGVDCIALCLWVGCPSCRAGVSGAGRELRHERGFLVSIVQDV